MTLLRKLRLVDMARILGWQSATVKRYIDTNPDRLHKYISEWGGQLLISEMAIPVLRGLMAEKHSRKEKKYGGN